MLQNRTNRNLFVRDLSYKVFKIFVIGVNHDIWGVSLDDLIKLFLDSFAI